MKCVSYTRTIPWRAEAGRVSIPEQNQRIADFIRNKSGWSLEKKYSDRKSAPEAVRSFEQLIEDGTERRFDCIVVYALYYCGNSFPMVRQMILETLYAAGIHLAVVSENFDTTEKSSQEVQDYFEEKRREMHTDICRNWRKSNGRQFVLTNSVPYGYIRSDGCDALMKDETVSEIVDEIFRMKLQGLKDGEIAAWLNERHVETPYAHRNRMQGRPVRDRIWTDHIVCRLLHRPIYMGVLTDSAGNIVIGHHHEPYLTEEEFYSISGNKRRDEPKRSIRQNYKSPGALAGVLICGHCGMPLQRRSNFETGEVCFVCRGKVEHEGACLPLEIPMDDVLQETLQKLREEKLLAQKANACFRNHSFREARLARREELSEGMQTILAEMEMEQFRRLPLYEQYTSGKITEPEYRSRREIFKNACLKLDQKLEEVMADAKKLEVAFSIKNSWIKLFTQAEIPEELDRHTVRRLVERVEILFPSSSGEGMKLAFYPKLEDWKMLIVDVLSGDHPMEE